MKQLLTVFLLLCSTLIFAQEKKLDFTGPDFRLMLSVGTHEIRIGMDVKSGLNWNWFSAHLHNSTYYSFKTIGRKKGGFVSRLEPGIGFQWGTFHEDDSRIYSNPIAFNRPNGFSYGLVHYFDNFGTTQQSGIVRFRGRNFFYEMENDFFSYAADDRYRTGAFMLGFIINDQIFYIKNIGWTGDPYAEGVPWIKDSPYPSKYGYTDMSYAPYGDRSAAVLSVGMISTLNETNQYLDFEIGFDHERIRHFFQNRLVHDSPLVNAPARGVTNPHIPMVDVHGKPYLFLPEQTLPPGKIYLQFGFNDFYLY